jgi:hypothetical protein
MSPVRCVTYVLRPLRSLPASRLGLLGTNACENLRPPLPSGRGASQSRFSLCLALTCGPDLSHLPTRRVGTDQRAAGQEIEYRIMLPPRQWEAAFHGETQTQTNS